MAEPEYEEVMVPCPLCHGVGLLLGSGHICWRCLGEGNVGHVQRRIQPQPGADTPPAGEPDVQ